MDSTNDRIKGKFHEVKGKIKETAGQVTNNPDLEAEGAVENLAGKIQKKSGPGRESLREIILEKGDRPCCYYLSFCCCC